MIKITAQGSLFVISGPSGVGKGSICELLRARNPRLGYSISATTRKPRVGELNGINYFFFSKGEFLDKIKAGDFLEWAEVYGNLYGTLKSYVEELQNQGKDVVLEIDTQGAMQVKKACPDSIFVFIMPPSAEELKKRIIKRGSESAESLHCRLSKSTEEMALADQYDYIVINADLNKAVQKVEQIINRYSSEA